jgi:hypothetical protein
MSFFKTRFARLSAALVLALGMTGVPASAQGAPPDCPPVEFLGLHGLNQGAEGGAADANYWGPEVDNVWKNFKTNFSADAVLPKSVSYPKLTVLLEKPPTLGNILLLDGAANVAASALVIDIQNVWSRCGNTTNIVLAGYSQGALAIDRAVRTLGTSSSTFDRLALLNVGGVFLMGDPGWPYGSPPYPDRAGVATVVGKGYNSKIDYLVNYLLANEFRSICLGFSGGLTDPLCMAPSDPQIWLRNLPVHGQYIAAGVTKNGADFLVPLAKTRPAR